MRVVLVGGSGYIGSHIARRLRASGQDVMIYDNLSMSIGNMVRDFPLTVADISDEFALRKALRSVDAVIHLAAHASVSESVREPREYFALNVGKSLSLINACMDEGVKAFIFSSSCAVYGNVPEIITEEHPCRPLSPYGTSKRMIEEVLSAYSDAYGMRYVSLRYFNAAGADESGELGEMHNPESHVIPRLIMTAMGYNNTFCLYGDDFATPDGTAIRDFLHVNDIADGHVKALSYLEEGGPSTILNLGSGHGVSIRELLASIERLSAHSIPLKVYASRTGDPPKMVASYAKAKRTIGWQPSYSMSHIIQTAWDWHRLAGFATVSNTPCNVNVTADGSHTSAI